MKKAKYKVIPYEQISNEYANSIGFITPEGNLIYIRKYASKGSHHIPVAQEILETFNDPCEDMYLSCEKLVNKYSH